MRSLFLLLLLIPARIMAQQAEPLLFKEKTHDFGEIGEGSGNAVAEFSFINNSGRAIKILSVQPSCGCTTPFWTREVIPAGSSGIVKASFDPKGRPGFFNKSMTVTTDAEGGPVVLQIKGKVIEPGHVFGTADYPVDKGSLRFKFNALSLDKVFINLPPTAREFQVYNASSKPIHFIGKINGPAYIQVDAPKELASNSTGVIKIIFDAKMKGQYGFVSENIEIGTDDESVPVKSFSVYATIEEFFPTQSADELKKAPAFRMDVLTFDLGKIHQGTVIDHEVGIHNLGKKELIIRAIQENCTCVKASVESMTIKPGTSSKVKISFSTAERAGTQQKAVTFYTNDPKNPVQRLTFTAYIGD